MSQSCIVVGAGTAGLAAAAVLTRAGIGTLVLEGDEIAGAWVRRYDRLRLHTTRAFSGLPFHPIPKDQPQYLTRDEFVKYLRGYARELRLPVVTGTVVQRIARDGAAWAVTASSGVWHAPVVIVATGQYRIPFAPSWPGQERYRGTLLHSISYANATPFAGLRVLVVGAGNSGAEIATDVAENGAAAVDIAVRTPPVVVPRDPFGMPVQRTSILLSALPPAISNRIGALTARITVGDLTRYGLPKATFAPYTTKRIALIDVGFVAALRRGLIRVRPAVAGLTDDGAVFADGSTAAYDAIIAATGFTAGLDAILDAPGTLDPHGDPQVPSGDPTPHPGLYFMGYTHSLRGHIFEVNRASHRLARNVRRFLS